MKKRAFVERLGDEIQGLFDEQDCFLLLMSDGLATGCDGILALQLLGHSLEQHFWEEGIPKDDAQAPSSQDESPRLVKVRKALKTLAAKSGAWFVVCYNLRNCNDWGMAWSDHIGPEEAFREVASFVQCGLQLGMD